MPNDMKDWNARDQTCVGVDKTWEVRHWCREFGCTEEQVKEAVRTVGTAVADVRAYLVKSE